MVKEIILFLLVIDQLSVVDCRRRIHVYPTLNYMSVIITLNLLKKWLRGSDRNKNLQK